MKVDHLMLSYALLGLGAIIFAVIKKDKTKLILLVLVEFLVLFPLFGGVPEEMKKFYPLFWATNVFSWLLLILVYIVHIRKSRAE